MKKVICAALSAAAAMTAVSAAAAEDASFNDVPQSHWAYEYITDMASQGIIEGYDDGSFMPEKTVTRAEFSKMLAGAAALSPQPSELEDVDNNAWYALYAQSAAEYLVPRDGLFMPDSEAKRKDIAAAVVRAKYYDASDIGDVQERFSDIEGLSGEEKQYIAAAERNGIMDGFDEGVFKPEEGITRAQAAAILSRAFGDDALVALTVGSIRVNINDVDRYLYLRIGGAQNISGENQVIYQNLAAEEIANVLISGEVAKAVGLELTEDYIQTIENIKRQAVLYENAPSIAFLDRFYTAAAYEDMLASVYKEEMYSADDIEEKKADYYKNNYFCAKHILVDDEQQANDLLKKAKGGADFDKLMNEYTTDPGTEYYPDGYVFTYNEMVPEFEECVKNTEIGGLGLCKSDYGYHVILRLELPQDYADAADSIEQTLANEYISGKINAEAEKLGLAPVYNETLLNAVG